MDKVQQVLGYVRWENFVVAIGRVIGSCKTLGISINDHFREVTKMISRRTLSIGATPKCLKFIIALQKANEGINKFGFVPVSLYKQLFLI
jgi:hypothetical protein